MFEDKTNDDLQAEMVLLKQKREKMGDPAHLKPEAATVAKEIDLYLNDVANELFRREPTKPLTLQNGPLGGNMPKTRLFGTLADGQRIPVYSKGEPMATSRENEGWVASFVRGSLGIGPRIQNLDRGTSTVPTSVSSIIIDLIRAKSRLAQAGAITVPVTGKTNYCRIDADPTVHVHSEGTDDISESAPTLTAVATDPASLMALIPLSMEIVQDSPNLDAALNASLAGAFAAKLDSLGITALLADANIPDSAAGQDTETWAGTLAGVGSALALNQDVPTALIANPADYIARAGEQASTAGSWLGAPPVLVNMLDLPTTSMTAGHAIFGDYSKGVAIVVRQDLRMELVRWGKPTYGSHLLAAYARMQAYVFQPNALYHQIKTVA